MDKTKIDIILDVSGSVIKSAEFLSHFAYLIHERFPSQVRVFAFVGLLDEVTDYYKNEDMQVAVKQSLKNANIDYRGYSNYDRLLVCIMQNTGMNWIKTRYYFSLPMPEITETVQGLI